MILSELRAYICLKKTVTLNELMLHFDMSADALRGMLSKWIKKGKLKQRPLNKNCGTGCCQCDVTLTELYESIE